MARDNTLLRRGDGRIAAALALPVLKTVDRLRGRGTHRSPAAASGGEAEGQDSSSASDPALS